MMMMMIAEGSDVSYVRISRGGVSVEWGTYQKSLSYS